MATDPRFTFIHANFRELADGLDRCGVASIDGILFDLGVSSMQFDDRERGFSLGKPAPLDMRMNPPPGRSAYDILSTASERELADIFFHYGEERAARRIAHAIVSAVRRARCRPRRPSLPRWLRASCIVPGTASASIPPRASSKRCASPSTTSSTRCATG